MTGQLRGLWAETEVGSGCAGYIHATTVTGNMAHRTKAELFPFLVFFGYGAHILTFATTFMPSFDAIGFYSKGDPYKVTPGFAFTFSKILYN